MNNNVIQTEVFKNINESSLAFVWKKDQNKSPNTSTDILNQYKARADKETIRKIVFLDI